MGCTVSQLYFGKEPYMFWTDLPSISSILTSLADSQCN